MRKDNFRYKNATILKIGFPVHEVLPNILSVTQLLFKVLWFFCVSTDATLAIGSKNMEGGSI